MALFGRSKTTVGLDIGSGLIKIAVIDHGGFAHAARALHRTQSVISYTIANLEEQLNVELLDTLARGGETIDG